MRWFHKRNKNKKEVDAAPAPPTERRQQQPPKNDASKGPEEQAPSPQSVQPAPAPVNEPSTQIRSPFGPDAAMNEEIMEIWTQLQDRVAQIAIREGKPVKNGLEVDDVLETLDSSQQPDEKNPGKTEKVKKVFGHMLGLIRTVGGIVSNGASQVFAPAGQCYNVISFVINAWDGYQSAFEGLAELLENCSEYLARLEYYVKGGMDAKLVKIASKQLLLFVRVCDVALKMRYSVGKKTKTLLKISFLSENHIDGLLREMAKLVDKEHKMVSAQTFQFASRAAAAADEGLATAKQIHGDVNVLKDIAAEQKIKAEAESNRKTILDFLDFDKSPHRWDSVKQEPIPSWQSTFAYIRDRVVVPGTGQWLFSEPIFQSWCSDNETSFPILGVEGSENSGKSCLTSVVVQHLRKQAFTEHAESRHLVSFYFLDKEKVDRGFDAVAKSLVWQFADSDTSYMQSAARTCEDRPVLGANEILPQLLVENKELDHIDATFYVVIDGLTETIDAVLSTFLEKVCCKQNRAIRIFTTGTRAAFDKLREKGIICPTIPISSKNRSDVEKFIDSWMDKSDALADRNQVGIAERRKGIRDTLYDQARGDYFKLDSALNQISKLDYMDDIERVIEGAGKESSEQIRDQIQLMNQNLSPREIKEVNEIILWTTFAVGGVTAEQMSAVLYFLSNQAPLRPLQERFRTKYLLFEVESDGQIAFKTTETLKVIPQRRQLSASNHQDGEAVQSGEVEIVKHFLNTVCPRRLYEKLELEQYLRQQITRQQDQIHQEDKDIAHTKLAFVCLKALTGNPDKKIAVLQTYARRFLVQHLSSVDLAMVDRDLKSKVGPFLVKLFTDGQSIDTLMWTDFWWQVTESRWLDKNDDSAIKILRWFQDTAVVSRIENGDRRWIADLVSGDGSEGLLKPFAVRMAVHCFREPTPEVETLTAFVLLYQYLVKSKGATDENKKVDLEDITMVEHWSQSALKVTGKDTLWELQAANIINGMRETWQVDNSHELVLQRCRRALELDSSNWRASHLLARVTDSDDEAIQTLTEVLDRVQNSQEWMQKHQKVAAQMNFDLANRYLVDVALDTYLRSIEQDPTQYMRILEISQRYSNSGEWAAILSLLDKLRTMDHLSTMAVELAEVSYFHGVIMQTAIWTQEFRILGSVYKQAIQIALEKENSLALFYLRMNYGLAHYKHPNRRDDKIIALFEAALNDSPPMSNINADICISSLSSKLSALYLQRACDAKAMADTEVAMEYVNKISNLVSEDMRETNLILSPQLFVARYYYRQGNKLLAGHLARKSVQVALEILSDDDEENDEQAFTRLLFVFALFDDAKNASTALAMTTLGGYQVRTCCDGDCGHYWTEASEMWCCEDCLGVCLERNCYTKLMNMELHYNICSKDHQFLFIPKWDQDKMDRIPKAHVPWGEEIVRLSEWREEIRKAYVNFDN